MGLTDEREKGGEGGLLFRGGAAGKEEGQVCIGRVGEKEGVDQTVEDAKAEATEVND
jgi:hypothetical protein